MKIDFSLFWKKILNPPTRVKILTFIVCILSAVGALLMLLIDYESNALAIVAYTLFGLAGVSLAYSVYLIVKIIPSIKRKFVEVLEKREFTRLILRDFGVRTIVFAIGSFIMSLIFSAFNAYMGIVYSSIWHGALAAYNIALAFLRGGVLGYHGKRLRKIAQDDSYTKAKIYRNEGIVVLILDVALSAAIVQMIFSNAHFTYKSWTIFAYAAYAFYKITVSIISFVKAQRQDDLTVRAIRNINLTTALVSILALQTALLSAYSSGDVDVSLFNTLTGIAVSLTTVSIGIIMIVYASIKMKKIKKEHGSNEQSI